MRGSAGLHAARLSPTHFPALCIPVVWFGLPVSRCYYLPAAVPRIP